MLPAILHFDLDAFFAAVEVLIDPSLAGKPLVIGADPQSRGVVATASYEARAFGIHSAMPIGRAYRLCPQAVFLPPRHGTYSEHSQRVFEVVARFSDRVQQVSIDEGYVSLLRAEDPIALARELKQAIRTETGLVASIGLAGSKLVAKVASDLGKPDGFLVVPPGNEGSFLAPLAIRKLWGVGPKTGERLAALGIETIGDLAAVDPSSLMAEFRLSQIEDLQRRARGEDARPVEQSRQVKSISDEHTFQRDEGDAAALRRVLARQCDHCARRLRSRSLLARTVTIKLRYGDFRTITRALSLADATDDSAAIRQAVATLMRRTWSSEKRPLLRLIGVRLSGLCPPPDVYQLRLFP